MFKTFSIVIINWNSGTQLKECIKSISNAKKGKYQIEKIIIIDNASCDNSLVLIDASQENIMIIKNNKNLGFGRGCNQGAKYSSSDFILFLNPDIVIFEDTFLNLFNIISQNQESKVAIYGVQLVDKNGRVQRTCARFPKMKSFMNRSFGLNKINPNIFQSYTMENWKHDKTCYVEQVIGAFFLVNRSIFKQLKGFDERFFVYYEELDFSKRVVDIGYKTKYITEAQAYHKGGGMSENVKAERLFYNTRSRFHYAYKHFGFLQGTLLMIFTLVFEPFSRIFFLGLKGEFAEIPEIFRGFIMLYADSLNIVKSALSTPD